MMKPFLLPSLAVASLTLASCSTFNQDNSFIEARRLHDEHVKVTPEKALEQLKAGNAHFAVSSRGTFDTSSPLRNKLAGGQRPVAVVLGCADSRTSPELIFQQGLGGLFVCRVAGNVTDPAVLGSIEYAVTHLGCSLVVVLGHTKCGAVTEVVEGHHADGNVADLLHRVHVGGPLHGDAESRVDAGVGNNVKFHVKEMTAGSTLLRDFVNTGRLLVKGAVYDLKSGKVEWQ